MGRIRTDEIRSITEKVLDKHSLESFSSSFRENKEKLKSMPEQFPSKKVLNRVAGSITRAFKQKQEEMKKLLEPGPADTSEEIEDYY